VRKIDSKHKKGYRIQNTVYLARVLIEEEKSMYNIFTIYIIYILYI